MAVVIDKPASFVRLRFVARTTSGLSSEDEEDDEEDDELEDFA